MEKPWESEPNLAHWVDDLTGLNCLILRARAGHLCGYVGVPEGHVLYEKEYNWEKYPEEFYLFNNLGVHGGVTWTSKRSLKELIELLDVSEAELLELGISYLYWIGFDCGHGCNGDYSPYHEVLLDAVMLHTGLPEIQRSIPQKYYEFDYVKEQVSSLAKQLYELDIY